jgi:hypothetical protein
MSAYDIQGKTLRILRILHEAGSPLGAARIAEELQRQGVSQSERMVRVYLERLDEEGLTRNLGRRGRELTPEGEGEVAAAAIVEKAGYVAARADTLAFQMSMDPGRVVVNISYIPSETLPWALEELERAFQAGLGVGELLSVARTGENIAGHPVPNGVIAIATVCSLTINGLFFRAGIPIRSIFGGLLQLEGGQPARFSQIIHYEGTTLDPLEVFIQGSMTSVRTAARGGQGFIGASFREAPSSARPKVLALQEEMERSGLGRLMLVGAPHQAVLDIPVAYGRIGVVLCAGLNPIAAVHERGVPTRSTAMTALMDRDELVHYSHLRRMIERL